MLWPWQRRSSPAAVDHVLVSPAGWAFHPPLQRQLSDEPPLILTRSFESWLPTRSAPQRMGGMGHLVASGAPAGTVAATMANLGAPVQRSVAADLTLRPPSWSRSHLGPATPSANTGVEHNTAKPGASEPGTDSPQATPDHMPLAGTEQELTADEPADQSRSQPDAGVQSLDSANSDEPDAQTGLVAEVGQADSAAMLQRQPENALQPPEAAAPNLPSLKLRRVGLGAPLTPPMHSETTTVQRADNSMSEPAVPAPASQPSAEPALSGAEKTPPPFEPHASESADETSETSVGPLSSMPPLDALSEPTPRAVTGVPGRPAESAPHGASGFPLNSMQRQSAAGITEGSAPIGPVPVSSVPTSAVPMSAVGGDTASGDLSSWRDDSRVEGVGDSADGGDVSALAFENRGAAVAMSLPAPAMPVVERTTRSTIGGDAGNTNVTGDASEAGSHFEPRSSAVESRVNAAQTVPLMAQRALSPMLSPVTMTKPADKYLPRATVVTSTDSRLTGRAAGGDRPGLRSVPGTRNSDTPHDSDGGSGGGFMTWLQRVVGFGEGGSPQADSVTTAANTTVQQTAESRAPDPNSPVQRAVATPVPASPWRPPVRPESARPQSPQPAQQWSSSLGVSSLGVSSLGGLPLGVVSPLGAVQTVARTVASTPTMPVSAAPRDRVVQREESAEPVEHSTTPEPTGPTETSSAQPPEPPEVATETSTAAGAASAAASTVPIAPASPTAIETLAGQLYGPLVRRLKTELLLDRERRGLRIDGI